MIGISDQVRLAGTPPMLTVVPSYVDPDAVAVARIYDYLLGGGYNFAADRRAAERLLRVLPACRGWAWASRAFLRRALLHLLDAGITQFLDLGCGLPSVRGLHEIAQQADPRCRVVYVDADPVVAECNRLHVEHNPRVGVVQADLRDVDAVLGHEVTRSVLDLTRPVGMLVNSVLHHFPEADNPAAVLVKYHDRLPTGSALAASHASGDSVEPRVRHQVARVLATLGIPLVCRTREELVGLLGPWRPAADDVVPTGWWRCENATDQIPEQCLGFAVLATSTRPGPTPVSDAQVRSRRLTPSGPTDVLSALPLQEMDRRDHIDRQ